MFLTKPSEEAFNRFTDAVFNEGKLDKKTKQLIALAVSYAVDCTPCIQSHYRGSVQAGATKEELQEAAAVVMAVEAGNKRKKHTPTVDALDAELNV